MDALTLAQQIVRIVRESGVDVRRGRRAIDIARELLSEDDETLDIADAPAAGAGT